MLADYRQVYDPLGNSLGLSSIVAALPLVTLFVLLGVLRMRAWLASIIGLAVALIVAVAAYSMSAGDAVNSAFQIGDHSDIVYYDIVTTCQCETTSRWRAHWCRTRACC